MPVISPQETNRLFGPLYRPANDTNVRHRAILRKAVELYSPEHLAEIFNNDFTHWRLVMGTSFMFSQFGKIKAHYVSTHIFATAFLPPANPPSDA